MPIDFGGMYKARYTLWQKEAMVADDSNGSTLKSCNDIQNCTKHYFSTNILLYYI
jgi:hypothetical protein